MVVSLEQQCGSADSVFSVRLKADTRGTKFNSEYPFEISSLTRPVACEDHPEIVRRKNETEVYGECLGCHAKVDPNSDGYEPVRGRYHHEKGTGTSDGRTNVLRIYRKTDYSATG